MGEIILSRLNNWLFCFRIRSSNPSAALPIFQFGSKETTTLSFASLASQTAGFAKDNKEEKAFVGTGRKLFGQPSNEDGEQGYDPEKEADFKPIVSLPAIVDVQTGEEDENVIYSHRAKLYRFDHEIKQWKERGVGDIKILVNPETNQCRVVMRRDQIRKLCANHFITREMELKENAGSDRSWVWSVNADFADGIAKAELLAVRFRHAEDAVMFQEKFKKCQEKLGELKEEGSERMEKASPVVDTTERKVQKDDDGNVEVAYDKFVECQPKELVQQEPKESEISQTEKSELVTLDTVRKETLGEEDVSHVNKSSVVTNEGEESENDSDEDVVITYETIPAMQEKELASRYALPETFYVSEESRSANKQSEPPSPQTNDVSERYLWYF